MISQFVASVFGNADECLVFIEYKCMAQSGFEVKNLSHDIEPRMFYFSGGYDLFFSEELFVPTCTLAMTLLHFLESTFTSVAVDCIMLLSLLMPHSSIVVLLPENLLN